MKPIFVLIFCVLLQSAYAQFIEDRLVNNQMYLLVKQNNNYGINGLQPITFQFGNCTKTSITRIALNQYSQILNRASFDFKYIKRLKKIGVGIGSVLTTTSYKDIKRRSFSPLIGLLYSFKNGELSYFQSFTKTKKLAGVFDLNEELSFYGNWFLSPLKRNGEIGSLYRLSDYHSLLVGFEFYRDVLFYGFVVERRFLIFQSLLEYQPYFGFTFENCVVLHV